MRERSASEQFGGLLREYRLRYGMNKTALSRAVGLPIGYISGYESAKKKPPKSGRIMDISVALDLLPLERARLFSAACGMLDHDGGLVCLTPEDIAEELERGVPC